MLCFKIERSYDLWQTMLPPVTQSPNYVVVPLGVVVALGWAGPKQYSHQYSQQNSRDGP